MIYLKGLPFTNGGTADLHRASCNIGYGDALNLGAAGQSIGGYVIQNTSQVSLFVWDATTGGTAMQGSEWSADGFAVFNITYFIS